MDSHSATFPARADAFTEVCAFVEGACDRAGVAHADALRVLLLVEELFVNTVDHGYGGDSDAPVRLTLAVSPAAIAIEYGDMAPPFDPFTRVAPESDVDDLEGRPVGGPGRRRITAMAHACAWAHRDGWNCISFRLSRTETSGVIGGRGGAP